MKESIPQSLNKHSNTTPWYKVLFGDTVVALFVLYLNISLAVFLFVGCSKQDRSIVECSSQTNAKDTSSDESEAKAYINDKTLSNYSELSKQTIHELRQVRVATAKYQNIENAYRDHYADINVVMANMGYHFMRSDLADTVFEIKKPEILVYNKRVDGSFRLVAVEYAVPIDLMPDKAPEGFTGSGDVWNRNTGFGLWLLHAWVWSYNPDGVFNPTNPLIHLR